MNELERAALLWCGCVENPPDAGIAGIRTPKTGLFHKILIKCDGNEHTNTLR
jgi:hypothetical protein